MEIYFGRNKGKYSKQVPHCNFYFICGGFIKGHALAVGKVLFTWFDNLGFK